MKMKNTKRSLLLSGISLLLCASMFMSSTFAWFTDTVSSGRNTIQSGNLDVKLEYYKADTDEWVEVDADTDVFGYTLWEPGHTRVIKFRVSNKGTLALKYQLTADVFTETAGVNKDGNSFLLSDYLYTKVVDADADRDDILDINDGYKFKSTISMKDMGELFAEGKGTSEEIVALAIWMPESTGNEANHNGEDIPEIQFGINLLATQLVSEEDSFGPDYDNDSVYADAFVTDAASLADALAEGGVVALMNDISVSDTSIVVPAGKSVVLNLNGNNIETTSSTTEKNKATFTVKGDMTVAGTGTVSIIHTGDNMGWNNLTAPFSVEGGTLTLGEGVSVSNLGGSDMAYAVDVNTTLGESTLNVDGAVLTSSYIGVRIFNNHRTEKGIVNFNSGVIQGEKNGYDIWAQLMSAPAENAVVNIADSFSYTVEDKSGKMYYIDLATIVSSTDKLKDALANGEDVVLTANITDAPAETVAPYGNYYGIAHNGGVLDGNGKTLDFDIGLMKNGKYDNYGIMTSGGTIKNVTITGIFRGIMIMNPTEDIIIDNVTIGDDDVCYAINTGEGDGTHSLTVTNSTLKGWSSYGTAISSVSFKDCTFAQGTYYTNVFGRLVKPYVNAVFDSCEFNSMFYIDLSQLGKDGDGNVLNPEAKITLKNCTVNGVKLTSENWTSLIASESDCGEGQISIEAKDGSYMSASNILDYVIIQ